MAKVLNPEIGSCSIVTSADFTVTVNKLALAKPISGFNTFATAIFVGAPKTLTLGTGYIGSIEWLSSDLLDGTYAVIAGETASTYVYTPAAVGVKYFKVRLTSVSPCTTGVALSAGVAVYAKASGAKSISGVKSSLSDFSVKSYPNPFRESFKLNFSGSKEKVSVQVYDMLGRKLESKEVSSDDANGVSLGQNLSSGIYNLRVIQGSNVKTLRVIKD